MIVENINENICVFNMGVKGLVVLDKFGVWGIVFFFDCWIEFFV